MSNKLDHEITEKIRQVIAQAVSLRRLAVYLKARYPESQLDTQADLDGLTVELPWDLAALRQARRTLGPGWTRRHTWESKTPDWTWHIISYRHQNFPDVEVWLERTLDLTPADPENGQPACRVVKVGERHLTEPIYEVVCEELT